jgi:hypothetical protein
MTHVLSTVGPLPYTGGTLHVLPSATLNKAYSFSPGMLSRISTDPATAPAPAAPLPLAYNGPITLVID